MIIKTNGFLEAYYERISSGEFIAGQEMKLELENLMNDLDDERYIYDTTNADLRIDFIEHCVRLTKSPFYGQPMKLMLFQKAYISALFGFKMAEDGNDRFKKSLFMIARKNGKTELCSAIGVSEFILGNAGSDIVCSSNDDMQASLLYDAVDLMRKMIDPNDLDTKRNQRFILNKETNTKIFKMSERTRNKEGRNIDVAFQDESHELRTNEIPKAIEQSQSLKENPKFINLTTEGFVSDGYLDDELKIARSIIYGENDSLYGERYLPWIYTQDSELEVFQNPKSWYKSNPSLGVVKKREYLEEQVDLAKTSKSDRVFVLSKDFNIKQNQAESWLNLEDYNYESAFNLEDFSGCMCLGAVDLSETTDLSCAKIMLMKPNDPVKYIHSHYFIPESKLEDSSDKNAGAKYKEWAEEGLLTITEGNDIDLAVVADWFFSLYQDYNIRLWRCGYDQRFAKDWLNRMSYYGWEKTGGDDSDVVMILQNAQTLSNAIKLAEADFKHKLIKYNNNAMDKWCFGNAGIKLDDKGFALIVKVETAKRIDGAVTLAILYETYRRFRTEFRTIVEK